MKVAVLNDLPVSGSGNAGMGSGAELTIGRFVKEGHVRGHDVDVVWADLWNAKGLKAIEDYDLAVVKNIQHFDLKKLAELHASKGPIVNWPSDYCFTKQRLFYAYQNEARYGERDRFWRTFLKASKLIVYLSPLHQEVYERRYPELAEEVGGPKSYLSVPPVHPLYLENPPSEWERIPDSACNINGLLEFKGLRGIPKEGVGGNLDWCVDHPGVAVTFIGSTRQGVQLPPNAKFAGFLPWRKLWEAQVRMGTYFERPHSPQPANHGPLQALLAGQHVDVNGLVGVASYPWFKAGDRLEARRIAQGTLGELWGRLEKVLA